MITFAILVDIFIQHLPARNSFDHVERLINRAAVSTSASEVVHLTASWVLDERMDESCDIQGMNIVSNLFSFIAEDAVLLPSKLHLTR